jgi:hypothetical protein
MCEWNDVSWFEVASSKYSYIKLFLKCIPISASLVLCSPAVFNSVWCSLSRTLRYRCVGCDEMQYCYWCSGVYDSVVWTFAKHMIHHSIKQCQVFDIIICILLLCFHCLLYWQYLSVEFISHAWHKSSGKTGELCSCSRGIWTLSILLVLLELHEIFLNWHQ